MVGYQKYIARDILYILTYSADTTCDIGTNMIRGENKCAWRYLKTVNTCERSCINELCSIHRAKHRNWSIISVQCRKCEVGVQTESRLCRSHGSDKIQHRLVYREKQTKHKFKNVMTEFL